MRAVLLAAGRGRRAGGPKAWLELGGRALLERQVELLSRVVGAAGVSVSIQPEWRERCLALAPEVRWMPVDPDAPSLASLQALLRGGEGPAFVQHVDVPVFDEAPYAALGRAAAEGGPLAWVPALGGRRGHPVLLSPAGAASVLGLDPMSGRLDRWLRESAAVEVPVSDAGVLRNLNFGVDS